MTKRLSLSAAVRVQPFTGLVIDVDTWATAHEYHRRHHQLHLLSLHGSGIANGLEVWPSDPPSDTVVVQPGVAIDQAGNVIIVPEAQRLTLEAREGAAYIVLDYVESLPSVAGGNQQETRGRLVEDYRLRVLPALPESPALELARVELAASPKLVIGSPPNPWSPGPNQIDGRYRPGLHAQAPREVSVGLVLGSAAEELDPCHLQGFCYFLRELGSCGLRGALVTTSSAAVPTADMLYVTGGGSSKPDASVLKGISEHLKRGAWLFGDACGAGEEFAQSLISLVKDAEQEGAKTEAQVLGAHFVFGSAPAGASEAGDIVWGRNAIISPRDYGCAWGGRHGRKALAREQIRSALEFGVNVAICASRGLPLA